MILTPQVNIKSFGVKVNNMNNILVISNDNGTIMLSKNEGLTYTTINLTSSGVLSRAAISAGYYPGYIVVISLTNIYTSVNGGTTWSSKNIINGGLPTGSIPYYHISKDGIIHVISYSFVNQTMNSTNIPSFFLISTDYGSTWTSINLNYRQILLSWDGLMLLYLSYGASPTLYNTPINTIDLLNITWNSVKQFSTPTSGYCPIINISATCEYITEFHIDSTNTNTIVNTSNDYGVTWVSNTSPYLINNAYNLDVTTVSVSGKMQSYWIYDATGTKYLSYSTDFGSTWDYINIYNTPGTNTYGVYDLTSDCSHVLLYQQNIGSIVYIKLSTVVNDLFATFGYKQKDSNSEQIDVTITPNTDTYALLLSQFTGIYSAKPSVLQFTHGYSSLDKLPGSVGYKLLSVIATKLFGNPFTTAAIVNDTDYINLTNSGSTVSNNIIYGISYALQQNKQYLFNQYVGSGIYSNDGFNNMIGYADANILYPFNLSDATISIPLNLVGSIAISGNTTGPLSDALLLLKSGYPSAGGTGVINGSYNIPFLLKFHFN